MESKEREHAKAVSPAFVLLDFQHAGVRRGQCMNQSEDKEVQRGKQDQKRLSDCVLNMFHES